MKAELTRELDLRIEQQAAAKNGVRIPRKKGGRQPLLMTHVVLGYPSLKESIDLVRAMEDGGASLVELQIPFSDPMADGPTIMMANEQALANGITPKDCMQALERLSAAVKIPLLFMSYYNLVFTYGGNKRGGITTFCRDAAAAGAQGLIVPDIPPEERGDGYWTSCREHGLAPIPLVSPLTSDRRMKLIAANASEGFVYCVSTTGTTGARSVLPPGLAAYTARVKRFFKIPRAVGFGLSTPAQTKALAGHAEIAVVGSAMIDLCERTGKAERLRAVREFTAKLAG